MIAFFTFTIQGITQQIRMNVLGKIVSGVLGKIVSGVLGKIVSGVRAALS